jgi:hypothetical protein
MDDFLGHRIARRRFAAEDLDARHPVALRIVAQHVPVGNGLQDVQELALVFMDALDLHVKEGVGADRDPAFFLNPRRQRHLVDPLGGVKLLAKTLFAGEFLQPLQPVEVILPTGADPLGDQL